VATFPWIGWQTSVEYADQTLAEVRQSFADISTMLNIAIALRRNSSHLLTLLRSMMIDLCEQIDRAVPSLPEEEGTRDA
jgi:hypothetical protein